MEGARLAAADRRNGSAIIPPGLAAEIVAVHADSGEGSPIVITAEAADGRAATQGPLEAAFRCNRVSGGTPASDPAVVSHFRCVDAEKANALPTTAESVAIDGNKGACEKE